MAVNQCTVLAPVCMFDGDSLSPLGVSYTDSDGVAISVVGASVDMTVTPVLSTTASLTYDETDTTEIAIASNTITYQIGATAIATLEPGTYSLALVVDTGTFRRTAIQQITIKRPSVA